MRLTFVLVFGLLAVGVSVIHGLEGSQAACPVTGRTVTSNSPHLDWQGQRIYFCCNGCPARFQADPEKYFTTISETGTVLENIQTTCPVSGEKLGSHGTPTHVDHKGRRVMLCCGGCTAEFNRDPDTYLDRLPGRHSNSR